MSNTPDAARDPHRPNVKLYMAVFGALLCLTLLTVAVSKLHLPRPQAIAVGLLIAAVKASLVAAIFMHLWGEDGRIPRILAAVVFFAAMMIFPILDGAFLVPSATSRVAVADQHPDEGGAAAPAAEKPAEVK